MGMYLRAGHVYSDTDPQRAVTGANLNEHVNEAVLLPTTISSQTLKDPAALSDKILIESNGQFFRTTLQQLYALLIQPGVVIQHVHADNDTPEWATTAQFPIDDTIPQIGEGEQLVSLSITPRFSSSVIRLSFSGQFDTSSPSAAQVTGAAAIFRDAGPNALVSQFDFGGIVTGTTPIQMNGRGIFNIVYYDSPNTTGSITYSVNVGLLGTIAGAVMAFNCAVRALAAGLDRFFGGTIRAVLSAEEIKQ
jgi:hypothetical protein